MNRIKAFAVAMTLLLGSLALASCGTNIKNKDKTESENAASKVTDVSGDESQNSDSASDGNASGSGDGSAADGSNAAVGSGSDNGSNTGGKSADNNNDGNNGNNGSNGSNNNNNASGKSTTTTTNKYGGYITIEDEINLDELDDSSTSGKTTTKKGDKSTDSSSIAPNMEKDWGPLMG